MNLRKLRSFSKKNVIATAGLENTNLGEQDDDIIVKTVSKQDSALNDEPQQPVEEIKAVDEANFEKKECPATEERNEKEQSTEEGAEEGREIEASVDLKGADKTAEMEGAAKNQEMEVEDNQKMEKKVADVSVEKVAEEENAETAESRTEKGDDASVLSLDNMSLNAVNQLLSKAGSMALEKTMSTRDAIAESLKEQEKSEFLNNAKSFIVEKTITTRDVITEQIKELEKKDVRSDIEQLKEEMKKLSPSFVPKKNEKQEIPATEELEKTKHVFECSSGTKTLDMTTFEVIDGDVTKEKEHYECNWCGICIEMDDITACSKTEF